NQLHQDINDYNQIIVGFNNFIEPLKSATNQIIDLKLTALTLKRHKSPEDKKIIIDAFCQRFAIDLKATVAEALGHLAIIFDKEPPPTLDDIAQAITDHRIYESFDYWAPVAYGNITDPFMDENIKHNFPDILTQKLYDQIPENVISKIEHSAERNHYSVKLNETNIPIPDDGVCFFSSCILAHVNARLEPISTVGAEEPSEEVPQDLKDHTLLSALPLDFSSARLNDLKKSPYFGAINALIECGVSFNSVKNTNHQLNRFLVNIDETQFEDMITGEEFKDPYQAPDGLTYDRDALEKTIKAKLNPDEGTPMADLSPAQRIESIKIGSNFFDVDEAQRMADDMAEFDIDAKVEHIMSLMTPNHDVRFIIHYKQNFDLAKTIATELRLTLSDQEINQILVDYRDQLPGNSSNSPEAIRNIFNQH
ncbi:MAG: hypothetical protein VXX85_00050, partial [Candidatus Margulisiibacteriota bacterium]|nr:hypothetical protein [Candidatus Margulisiibacteriota bacterium]